LQAHIAGLPDGGSRILRLFKWIALKQLAARRREIASFLHNQHHQLSFFNGGGTGDYADSAADAVLTEITVGSGALQSAIFDHFQHNTNQWYGMEEMWAP